MNATTTFAAVARELADAFETQKRNDGEEFVVLKDDAPAWIEDRNVSHEAHKALDDRGPDDWTYAAISRIADDLAERDFDDAEQAGEAVSEIADGLVDVYNLDRAAWLALHLNNAFLVDDANEEYGHAETLYESIGRGQYLAYERIAYAVIACIEAEANERDGIESEEVED